MKNLLFISIMVLSVLVLNAQESKKKTRKQKKAEKEALLTEQTKKLVESKSWKFDASSVNPARGRTINLTTSYDVKLKNDTVMSYLPYFGRAYNASYGSSESPMIFNSEVENYTMEDAKKGGFLIKLSAKNRNDKIDFSFHISATGYTTLYVSSTNRQSISYFGYIVPMETKK